MAIAQVNAGDRINASDLNAFYALLKGVAASGENVTLIYNAGALTFQPSSDPSAGTRVLTIKNNAGTTLFAARYDGLLEMLAAAAAPGSPVAGSVYWDTLLAALRVYDGTNWRDMAGGSGGPNPNLVLNSDFSRRTVFGLAMPEVFADLSGTTKIDAGAAGSVAANIFTQGAANNEYAWCAGSFVWRDGRASATFKATAIAGIYQLKFRESATTWLSAKQNNGNFTITSSTATADVVRATVANVLTINQWYWIEIEVQGTTIVGKIYSTGTTTAGTVKASGTLVQTLSFTGVTASAGSSVSITSDQAAAQWGGIATGNGGVYVETWLPESWAVDFGGTLGGQAIGYNEGTDGGPIGRQNNLKAYIPATSRSFTLRQNSDSSPTRRTSTPIAPSTAYAQSIYVKTTSASGAGLLTLVGQSFDSALANVVSSWSTSDAAETSWTRKTAVATSDSTARFVCWFLQINPNTNRTGTVEFQLPQLEQGSAVTAWRESLYESVINAEVGRAAGSASVTTTSATMVEGDPRDLAINFFAPWDCVLDLRFATDTVNSGLNANYFDFTVDGVQVSGTTATTLINVPVASKEVPVTMIARTRVAAGKHRIAVVWQVSAGTGTFGGTNRISKLYLTATRGK